MIKTSQLVGRAVIDMEGAQRLGKIREIIVERDGQRLAGFVVVHGETIVGSGGTRRTVPASALHSIGPDAVTVRGSGTKERTNDLDKLPRMSDVIGHKMVTRSGRLLGSIDDVLIDGADGTIIGYVVGEGVRNRLENIFNPQRSRIHGYVRADADLKVGDKLIVVPDDALIEGEPIAKDDDRKSSTQIPDAAEARGWRERASTTEPARSSIWTRQNDTEMTQQDSLRTPTEPRLTSETARPIENNRPIAAPTEKTEPEPPDTRGETLTTGPRDQRIP